ncbi:MAG: ThiF family adenylyltransferase [Anaerolineae bacterium]|nr:ThiF family adenylyltransferase [Anaerolineae bacterium]
MPEIGPAGQEQLLASSVAVVGCGALGTVAANAMVRAGVGRIRVIDRDAIELSNLQRQVLFDEDDIARGLPKAVAAAEKLRRVNSEVVVEDVVADVNAANVESLVGDVDLILDGTDNFETRFLLNDVSLKYEVPWVYAAVLSTYGMIRAILPHRTPCFRCFLAELPPPGSTPTCDTVGVLGPAVNVIASLQAVEGLKILMGKEDELYGALLYVDVWSGTFDRLDVNKRDQPCPACDQDRFDFLEANQGSYLTSLCGRNAIQVNVRGQVQISLSELARRLNPVGEVRFNEHMLRFQADEHELTVFPDGRAIVTGTTDAGTARAVYARYVGL